MIIIFIVERAFLLFGHKYSKSTLERKRKKHIYTIDPRITTVSLNVKIKKKFFPSLNVQNDAKESQNLLLSDLKFFHFIPLSDCEPTYF